MINGLVQQYMADEEVKLFVGMVDGLAFLPENDVVGGMRLLRRIVPNISRNCAGSTMQEISIWRSFSAE